jgi:hypothetical protein
LAYSFRPQWPSGGLIRKRLPLAIHEQVFTKVLAIAQGKTLLKGQTVAVDSTLIEARRSGSA